LPNDQALIWLSTSVVIEQNDEWLVGLHYLRAVCGQRDLDLGLRTSVGDQGRRL
jgi:hypothetical protein